MTDVIDALLARADPFSTSDVATRARVSRQAAHRHLTRLVRAGRLRVEGQARATRYHRADLQDRTFRYAIAGLAEDRVLSDLERRVPELSRLSGEARDVFAYAFLEIVNNAIDHSSSEAVEIRVDIGSGSMAFEVVDRGIGAWAHLRRSLALESDLEAIQEVSKGKVTTAPDRHTGEGLFFVSKAGDRFEIESGTLGWIVDNLRNDTAILAAARRQGTRVKFAARIDRIRPLAELFRRYTDDHEFSRTRTYVRLFDLGLRFLSRSEARRMMRGLERFREVILDFRAVPGVGQGFADEVFRVWARAHPEVRLVPIEMNEPVAAMVNRAQRAASEGR